MPIPRISQERCLILSDGGLESAVVAAIAAEQTVRGGAEPSVVLASWWGGATDLDLLLPSVDRAVSRQAEIYGLGQIPDQTGYPPEDQDSFTQENSSAKHTQLILQGAYIAASLGIRRVVWPIRVGSVQRDFDPNADLDLVGSTIDRGVLAGRLATLDVQSDTRDEQLEISIEMPLVDFSNIQLADLAGDLSVSLSSCWWSHDRQVTPSAQGEYEYWSKRSVLGQGSAGASYEVKSFDAQRALHERPAR